MGLDSETAIQIVEFIKSQAEQHRLNFLRPKRLEGVQFVFFDELNREADPRFLDSCMELVQFRSINGQPVPSLELVWGAQNPPNSIYKVRTLDVPLVDKFGAHIALEGNPDIDWYVSKGYNPHTVATVVSWYNSDLDEDEREVLSPRALENIMRLVDNGVDPEFGLLEMAGVRGHLLTAKLHRCDTSHRFAQLDLVTISANPLEYIEYAKNDIDFCAFFSDLVRSEQNPTNVLRVIPVWMAMTHDFQNKCLTDADWVDRMFNALGNVAALSSEVTTLPGYHNFAEMIKQFH